MVKIGRNNYVF